LRCRLVDLRFGLIACALPARQDIDQIGILTCASLAMTVATAERAVDDACSLFCTVVARSLIEFCRRKFD